MTDFYLVKVLSLLLAYTRTRTTLNSVRKAHPLHGEEASAENNTKPSVTWRWISHCPNTSDKLPHDIQPKCGVGPPPLNGSVQLILTHSQLPTSHWGLPGFTLVFAGSYSHRLSKRLHRISGLQDHSLMTSTTHWWHQLREHTIRSEAKKLPERKCC